MDQKDMQDACSIDLSGNVIVGVEWMKVSYIVLDT